MILTEQESKKIRVLYQISIFKSYVAHAHISFYSHLEVLKESTLLLCVVCILHSIYCFHRAECHLMSHIFFPLYLHNFCQSEVPLSRFTYVIAIG